MRRKVDPVKVAKVEAEESLDALEEEGSSVEEPTTESEEPNNK